MSLLDSPQIVFMPSRDIDLAGERILEITRSAFLINPETGKRIEGDTPLEVPMVRALFERGAVEALHVALCDREIVGYVLYSEGSITENPGVRVLALTIMGVAPEFQRQGIGTTLLCESVKELRGACDALFVLGHPSFYPRAGFVLSAQFGISFSFPAPVEACMIMRLSFADARNSGVIL